MQATHVPTLVTRIAALSHLTLICLFSTRITSKIQERHVAWIAWAMDNALDGETWAENLARFNEYTPLTTARCVI